MPSDLTEYIEAIRVIDTHSHMQSDIQWAENGPRDVLIDLFGYCSEKGPWGQAARSMLTVSPNFSSRRTSRRSTACRSCSSK